MQVYLLFRRLMLVASAQSPRYIQRNEITTILRITNSVLIQIAVQQLVFVRLMIAVEGISP